MCKVYEFPKHLELPKEEAELLTLIGEAYTKALYNSLAKTVSDISSREEMEQVAELVNAAFVQGMSKAITDMEES